MSTGRRLLPAEDMPINAEIMKELLQMRDMTADHSKPVEPDLPYETLEGLIQ